MAFSILRVRNQPGWIGYILDILKQNSDLFEDDMTFRIVSETVAELIDDLGRAKTLRRVKRTKDRMLPYIRMLTLNHKL